MKYLIFYETYFTALDEWLRQDRDLREASFLNVLQSCESVIGHQQNYGEIKAYVLMQTLRFLKNVPIILFCSDDFGARQGFANGAGMPCISILSVFLKLKYIGKTKEETEPYFQSLIQWYRAQLQPQDQVRVWKFSEGSWKRLKVPLGSVLSDVYEGKYKARKNGDLEESIKGY